ncbi:MAG: amidohydrolase family protein [Pseudomonadota bacterium]|nr:amidohydrolase family protein [Pseudomonadota bacterium]
MNDKTQPTKCDLLIINGCVLTMDHSRTIYKPGGIAVTGNTITAVGAQADIVQKFRASKVFDAQGAVVHPGFIDAHNHVVHQTCRGVFADTMASSKQPVSFADWKADAHDEDENAAAALACLELLNNGFTAFVEPGTAFCPDAVASAAEQIGVRGAVTDPYLWDRPDILEHAGGLRSESLLKRSPPKTDYAIGALGGQLFRNRDPDALVRGYISLYGEGTASDDLEKSAKEMADNHKVVFQQHEGYLPEIASLQKTQRGVSRMVHLSSLGVLDQNSTLIHVNAIFDEDVAVMAQANLSIIWCPVAYLSLGIHDDAPCRIPALARMGINVALGTDAALECTIGDAGRTAYLVAKDARDPISYAQVIEMQTINAAVASGLGDITGSLEEGKRADIVVRRDDVPDAWPGFNPVHQVALTARGGSVRTVIVDGIPVYDEGQPLRTDPESIFVNAHASVKRRVDRLSIDAVPTWPVQ